MANTITGMGVALRRGDGGGPEVFTKIAQITNIQRGPRTQDILENTNMDVIDGYKTFIGGNKDAGPVTLTGFYDAADAGHIGLQTDQDNSIARNFELAFPAPLSKTETFAALVQDFQDEEPFDGLVTFSVTLKRTGKPTVA